MTARKRKPQRGAVARPIDLVREAKLARAAKAIRREFKSLGGHFRRTVKCAVSLGGRLARFKKDVLAGGYGDWMQQLKKNRIPYHSTERLISLHHLSRNAPATFSKLQNLLPVTALCALAKQPLEVIEETAKKLESEKYLTMQTKIVPGASKSFNVTVRTVRRSVVIPSYLQQSSKPVAPPTNTPRIEQKQATSSGEEQEQTQEQSNVVSFSARKPAVEPDVPDDIVEQEQAQEQEAEKSEEPEPAAEPSEEPAPSAPGSAELVHHDPDFKTWLDDKQRKKPARDAALLAAKQIKKFRLLLVGLVDFHGRPDLTVLEPEERRSLMHDMQVISERLGEIVASLRDASLPSDRQGKLKLDNGGDDSETTSSPRQQ